MRVIGYLLILACAVFAQPPERPFIAAAAARAEVKPNRFESKICNYSGDPISARVLREYGSIFVASDKVVVPQSCVFPDAEAVTSLQAEADLTTTKIGSAEVTLQREAMRALLDAIDEAAENRLKITPLDGTIAGTRSYEDTVRLWNSRFYRALDHWQRLGRISKADADVARSLPAVEQVPLVLKWEEQRIWFSTGFSRSILTSVAAPGTSQHLSGLAFDIVEYRSSKVRTILNKYGWYQTVLADEPHFTYLGHPELDLPKLGLISKPKNGYKFWVPAI